jgi:hypothetical protein
MMMMRMLAGKALELFFFFLFSDDADSCGARVHPNRYHTTLVQWYSMETLLT